MKKIDFDALREDWLAAAVDGDMGLWWVAQDLREDLGYDIDEAVIRRLALEAVRPLLESGQLRAVTLLPRGEFELWPGDVDQVCEAEALSLMASVDLESVRGQWLDDCARGTWDLSWLAHDLGEVLGRDRCPGVIRRLTLEALRPLLASGELRAVARLEDGTYEAWPGDTDAQLARIEAEWKALGRNPTDDEVGYFTAAPLPGRGQA